MFPKIVRYLTAAVFTVFFCVALNLALQSAASCGCFGRVHVDPRITACMDGCIVLLLLFSKVDADFTISSRRRTAFFISGVILPLFLFIPMSLHPPVVRVEHIAAAETIEDEPKAFGLFPETLDIGFTEPKTVHRLALDAVNPSDAEITIDRIKSECECIAIIETLMKVPPKSQSPVLLEFTAPDISGTYIKSITVSSGESMWTARLKARINHPLAVEPETLTFKKGEKEKSFQIVNAGKQAVKILYATSVPSVCTVAVDATPTEAGQSKPLSAVLHEAKIPDKITIKIYTNHLIQKMIELPVVIGE